MKTISYTMYYNALDKLEPLKTIKFSYNALLFLSSQPHSQVLRLQVSRNNCTTVHA